MMTFIAVLVAFVVGCRIGFWSKKTDNTPDPDSIARSSSRCTDSIEEHDLVALKVKIQYESDGAEVTLHEGNVGTVINVNLDGTYLVEFAKLNVVKMLTADQIELEEKWH